MPGRKTEAIHRRLRALFERRDRKVKELEQLEAMVNAEIRALADNQGISFIRAETARKIAFGLEIGNAA